MAAPLASKAGSAGTNSKPPFPELDFRSGARVEELNKLIQEFTKHDQREYDDQRALEIHTAKDFIFSMLGRAGSVRGGGSGDAGRGPRGRAPGRCGTGRPFPRAAGTPGSGVPGRRAGLTPRKLFFACPVRPVFSSDGFRSTEQRLGRRAGRCPRNTPNRQGWRRGEPDPSLCFPPAIKAVGNTDYFPPPPPPGPLILVIRPADACTGASPELRFLLRLQNLLRVERVRLWQGSPHLRETLNRGQGSLNQGETCVGPCRNHLGSGMTKAS